MSEQKQLKTIAVDLTPIIPGGGNGGAKIFILELLQQMAVAVPATRFLLLTHAASHEELAGIEQHNMQRVLVAGVDGHSRFRLRLKSLLAKLPLGFYKKIYKLITRFRKPRSSSFLRGLQVDLLFCPFTAPAFYEPGVPVVCTIYDLQYASYPAFFEKEEIIQREHTFIEACRRATVLTAISDYSRETAIHHGKLDPAQIRTIYLRMAQRFRIPQHGYDEGILNTLGLVARRYMLFPANFWQHKNHEMLLIAFSMAMNSGSLPTDMKLVCTGAPGPRQDWLKSAVCSMGLTDQVLFPGYLADEELGVVMQQAAGLIFPSLYEGFGLPVIEAMATGLPVACSNTTSLPEVVGNAAILFDPRIPEQIASAMICLTTDEPLRQRLIEAGRQRAIEFSDSGKMVREYWELFMYAVAHTHHANLLTGVYTDGWASPLFSVLIVADEMACQVELSLTMPDWLPYAGIKLSASHNGIAPCVPLEVTRGSSVCWEIPLSSGGCCEISCSRSFVPAWSGENSDQRELSIVVQHCRIKHVDGRQTVLFPEGTRL